MPRAVLNPELKVSTGQPRNVGGRPTKFNNGMLKKVYELSLLGFSDKAMSIALDVSVDIFSQWKRENVRFSRVIKAGRDEAAGKVARRIFEQACGYRDPDGKWHEPSLSHQRWFMAVKMRDQWPLLDEKTGAVNVNIGAQQPAVVIDETDPREAMKAYQAIITGQPFVPSPRSNGGRTIDVEPSE